MADLQCCVTFRCTTSDQRFYINICKKKIYGNEYIFRYIFFFTFFSIVSYYC